MKKKLLLSSAALLIVALAGYRISELGAEQVLAEVHPVRVEVTTVQPESLSTWAFAEGTAEALRKAFLNFEQAGKVVYLGRMDDGSTVREGARVFGPNDEVRNGQQLARIDNRENASQVEALEAQLQSARSRRNEAEAGLALSQNDLEQARHDFQRIEEIYKKGVVSRDEFERFRTTLRNAEVAVEAAGSSLDAVISEVKSVAAQLNQATVSLEKTSLFAPFDGVISTMNIRQDNYYYPPAGVNSNREREASSAIVVVDDSQYEIQLEVTEQDAMNVREGQTVYLASDDLALYRAENSDFSEGDFVTGTVWSVSPSLSLQKRSRLVKVRTSGDSAQLRDGMFVRAWIATKVKTDVLTIPWQVLSFREGQPFVYVVNDDQRVELRWLVLGLQGLEEVEVLGGLSEGERVVTRGQHLLKTGSRVKVLGDA
ncbi:MAG: efflux RND transporter periplasmic adaptor subunit [Endozoicomonas sp.]